MINQTADECDLDRLLLTAAEEFQTLKDVDQNVVISGKGLARIYHQLIDVIRQLRQERRWSAELEKRLRNIAKDKQKC